MYERIVVPLDGSSFSEEIIPYAKGLAAVHGTELVLVRVVEKESDKVFAADYIDELAATHNAHGLCLVDSAGAALALLEEAGRRPATLLAMTSRGYSGLAEMFLGSVAQRVMRGASEPVLLYRPTGAPDPKPHPVKITSVVLPLDGEAHSEAMGSHAAEFAHWIQAQLEVVSVIGSVTKADLGETSDSEMASMETSYVRSKANELAKRYDVQINWDALHGDPVEAIVSRVAHRRDVIVAMATRRTGPLDAAVLGTVAGGCLRKAGVPVLMRLA